MSFLVFASSAFPVSLLLAAFSFSVFLLWLSFSFVAPLACQVAVRLSSINVRRFLSPKCKSQWDCPADRKVCPHKGNAMFAEWNRSKFMLRLFRVPILPAFADILRIMFAELLHLHFENNLSTNTVIKPSISTSLWPPSSLLVHFRFSTRCDPSRAAKPWRKLAQAGQWPASGWIPNDMPKGSGCGEKIALIW